MSEFVSAVRERIPILTDGGIETRVMFETDYPLDPDVQVAAMVGDPNGRPLLWKIYAGYVEVAREFDLPVVIGTPTFRASRNFARRAGLDDDGAVGRLNADAAELQHQIRAASGHEPVFIAGVIGPSGDAYLPAEALDANAGAEYHREQARALAESKVDFLFAPTFPAVEEAVSACRAMAETELPYVISFVLDRDGAVLDGTSLAHAVERVDAAVEPAPLYHSISCVHSSVAAVAVAAVCSDAPEAAGRVRELKANGSPLPTTELVKLSHPESDPPQKFGEEIWALYDPDGLHVLGGCCGTTDDHMRALARLMADGGANGSVSASSSA